MQPLQGIVVTEAEDRDADDRAALHAELEASLAEAEAGEVVDFAGALADLRQRL
jgi:predicted transcriptional regulator